MSTNKRSSLMKYLKLNAKAKTMTVAANTIDVYVPEMYSDRGIYHNDEYVSVLGILKVVVNKKIDITLMMTTMLTMVPSSVSKETIDDYPYIVLHFNKGDLFIRNTELVKDSKVMFDIFNTFINLGKIPPFISYSQIQHIFDNDKLLVGLNFGINHSTYEVLFAHMYRDKKDVFKFYRYTPMKDAPEIVSMNQISHGPVSASSRMIGGYMNDGVVSALVHDNEDPSVIENLLRA